MRHGIAIDLTQAALLGIVKFPPPANAPAGSQPLMGANGAPLLGADGAQLWGLPQ